MHSSFLLILNKRIKLGKQHSNNLRNNGKVPAIVYNNNLSIPVYFDKIKLNNILKIINTGFSLINCELNNEKFFVFIKDVYRHPSKLDILHLDLQRVKNTDIVTSKVLLNFINEKDAPGLKKGGFLIKHMSSINIKACVMNIPKHIDIDLSSLDFNEPIFLSDITLPENIKISTKYKNASELLVISAVVSRTGLKKDEKAE